MSKTWISLTTLRDEATKDPLSISSPPPQSLVDKVRGTLCCSLVEELASSSSSSSSLSSLPDGFSPRLAKDETYATDILKAWNDDFNLVENTAVAAKHYRNNDMDTFGSVFPYKDCDGVHYSGYLVIPANLHKRIMNPSRSSTAKKVPVVIIFHTGAGPQDIFNRYKACQLARQNIWCNANMENSININNDDGGDDGDDEGDGCIIFIADIVSDFVGWTWGDRDRYWQTRKELLQTSRSSTIGEGGELNADGTGEIQRTKLRQTLSAVVDAVKSIDIADCNRIAAMGFCLGGQPILELGRMQIDGIVGLISFHGLFDGVDQLPLPSQLAPSGRRRREVLICNGKKDPHVPESDLSNAKKVFESAGWTTTVLNFENAMHNFSNPRTQYDDPNAAFGYDEDAATTGWNRALDLLQEVFELGR